MVTVSTHPRAVESRSQSAVTPAQAIAILRERTRVGRGAGIASETVDAEIEAYESTGVRAVAGGVQ